MKNKVKCPNCGEDVEEFRLIEINTGRRTQRFCPKCYGYGSKQADARNVEVKLKLFLQYQENKGKSRFGSK